MKVIFKIILAVVIILTNYNYLHAFNEYEAKVIDGFESGKIETNYIKRDSLIKQASQLYYVELNKLNPMDNQLELDTYFVEVALGKKKMSNGLRKRIQKKFGEEFYVKAYWLLVDLRFIEMALMFDSHRQAIYFEKNKHEGHCECGKCGNG